MYIKLDLYINVDPPDHETGLAITTPDTNKHAPITKIFLIIPIGGMLTIFQKWVKSESHTMYNFFMLRREQGANPFLAKDIIL